MTEENNQSQQKQIPAENKGEKLSPDVPVKEEISPLDEAKTILEENRKVLIALTEERKKIEKAAANMMIGGRALAGQSTKEESEEEKWAKQAKVRYAGTGLDPT